MVLTDIGVEVAGRGEQVLAEVRDLVDFARHRSSVLTGRLILGVIPTSRPRAAAHAVDVPGSYPELQIELRETQTRVLLDELARGQLDVVMLALPLDPDSRRWSCSTIRSCWRCLPDARSGQAQVSSRDIEQDRLILLEEGHCLRDQALTFCANARGGGTMGLGATSLATVMQMVANGYGVTLVPQVAVDVEVRDDRVKLLRFASPQPGRTIGLAWRRTSPRKSDFIALGQLVRSAGWRVSAQGKEARGRFRRCIAALSSRQ